MASRPSLILGLLLMLTACAGTPELGKDTIKRTSVSFGDLPGWQQDHVGLSIPALIQSCAVLKKKAEWSALCTALALAPPQGDTQARQFFERWFHPYAVAGKDGSEGLFTGYYEAELQGALQQGGIYQTPLYAKPEDLVSVDLGAFKTELQGQHVAGKVVPSKNGAELVPYDDRADIDKGSLAGRAHPLVWVDSPIDAFFLAIQGSGRVQLADHSILRVGYDGTNSHAYVAVGRVLAERNEIQKPVTMQSIRAWMTANPDRARQIMNLNPSYVFFKILKNIGPIGAEGVALTPQRSLAIDPAFITLGSPVWLDTVDGKGDVFQHLVVAQDTGGAIKGVVRGDVFWGYGSDAEIQAGAMQSRGRYFVLMPKAELTDARS